MTFMYKPPPPEFLDTIGEVIPNWLVKRVTIHEHDPLNFTRWQVIVVLRWPAWVGFGLVHTYYQEVLKEALGGHVSVWVW